MYVRCSRTKGDFCYHKRQNVSANGFARASCRAICHFHVRCTPDTIMFIASSAAYLKQNFTAVTSIRFYSLLYYNPFTRILIVRFILDTKQRNFFPSTTVLPTVIYESSRNWQNIIAKHLVLNDVEPRSAGVVLCQNDTFIRYSISKKLRYLRDDTVRCSIDPGNVIINWWACLMTSWHMGNLQARLQLVADVWNFL